MPERRRQLTLFVSEPNGVIEKIRAAFNPLQFHLIPAHITLCREDEIEPLDPVIQNLRSICLSEPLRIEFGLVERFGDGKGVLLPGKLENPGFDKLRKTVLNGIIAFPRDHRPHITLMHPRNSTCTAELFERIKGFDLPSALGFDTISLIEQKAGGPWRVLEEFPIHRPWN